jgi:hypothetical protein
MELTIGQTIFAIGFKHADAIFNLHYTVETLDRPAKRHYYALTVVEERDTVEEYTGTPVLNKKGYVLVDQNGVKWNRDWPACDSSGRGIIFDRNTDGMSTEQIQHIVENEVCECRDISGFFTTLIMETEDLRNPPSGPHISGRSNSETVGKRRENVVWMERHRNYVVSEIKEQLFVDVRFTPHTDKDGQVLNEKRFVKAELEDSVISGAGVKAMTFMAMFGDMKNWAHIFLGHLDFEWACHAHFEVFGNFPSNTKHLRDPKVKQHMDMMKRNMRNYLQGLVDNIAEPISKPHTPNYRPAYTPPMSATLEAEQFRDMSKPSEFGTIAEICAKYGISKSEARRRKAEGTLHELERSNE